MVPLSIIASIIAVIGLADRIISISQGYVAKMKDTPSDLRAAYYDLLEICISLITLTSWGDVILAYYSVKEF